MSFIELEVLTEDFGGAVLGDPTIAGGPIPNNERVSSALIDEDQLERMASALAKIPYKLCRRGGCEAFNGADW